MTIPSVLKTTGSSSGQAAAVAVSSVAAIINTAVRRAIGRPVFWTCRAVQIQAAMTATTAIRVTQPWA